MPEATSNTPVQTEEQLQSEQQLVRHSVQYLQKYMIGAYGNVKSWSPAYLQNGLATLESSSAVNALTGQLESVSEPLINSLDQRLDGAMQNLEISNLSDLKSKVTTKAVDLTSDIKTGIETRAENLKTGIETRAEKLKCEFGKQTEPLYNKALELQDGLQNIKASKQQQWKSVRGDLSKKTKKRIEDGFTTVKQFSADQAKGYLKIDLIQYATEVLDNAQSTVKPTFDVLNAKIASGILTVNQSITSFQEMAVEKSRVSMEQADAFRAELRSRLSKAIAASRELSQHSAEYVLVRYRKIQNLDREQLQATWNESFQYILEAPQLFAKLTARLEQFGTDFTSINAVESINRLLASLQEVVLPRKSPSEEPQEGKECKVEEEEIQEEKESKVEDEKELP